MRNLFILLFTALLLNFSYAQEFNATVTIDARQTGQTRLRIFNILEESLEEFINQTAFTNEKYSDLQKIDCSFFITINNFESDRFQANIQVQASRPVFGSSIKTPIINVKDEDFNFSYTESEPLIYDVNNFQSNLTSVVSFYLYTILGLEADSFSLNGGNGYHETARQIVNAAQSNVGAGWQATGVGFSRFNLNNDILSQNFADFRQAFYDYHIKGLDLMHKDTRKAKENIIESIALLKSVNDARPNSVLLRLFFDTKAGEIQQILNGGPKMDIAQTKEHLYRIAPVHNNKWRRIKY
ncbi:type IX secretion system protein PorD [Flavobacteriaceae bacterium 14752]|uniref:type IX secretion system protein PorD n=1 Tax=Mesohalobacter salilacus TaxID=2491711 RepID=UPI000F63FC27|nr:DUF4835 family protein [Flavobacteriaceae bacterium 14752]